MNTIHFNNFLNGSQVVTLNGNGQFNNWLFGSPLIDISISGVTPEPVVCPKQFIVRIRPIVSKYSVRVTNSIPPTGFDVAISPTVECIP